MATFQYISCYGLSAMSCRIQSSRSISIHLMLRFIRENISKFMNFLSFQYISCYGLSMLRLMPWLMFRHFNTSHVTVYPAGVKNAIIFLKFQYISCYGLSTNTTGNSSTETAFQYISCYGLSVFVIGLESMWYKFQYISCYGLSNLSR